MTLFTVLSENIWLVNLLGITFTVLFALQKISMQYWEVFLHASKLMKQEDFRLIQT